MEKFIVNAENTIRIPVVGSTTQILAAAVAAGADIGLSSIKELVAGRKQEVKGYTVIEVAPEPEVTPEVVEKRTYNVRPRYFVLTPNAVQILSTVREYRGSRYREMVDNISQGVNTVDALVEKMDVKKSWVMQEVCRAKRQGVIEQRYGVSGDVEETLAQDAQETSQENVQEVAESTQD